MSEPAPVNYNDGDIVWVKLGPCWWPGEVKDVNNLPSEVVDFKKPPLAIVKFFEEDTYEYVKNTSHIFPYKCDKKNDFIKKGLTSSRTRMPNLEKFKSDIIAAEIKTDGNANILTEPQFLPEKRINYVAEIFGTPNQRKSTGLSRKKGRSSVGKSNIDQKAHITHRRFLGYDDYEAHICVQYPGKDREPASDDDEVMALNKEPEEEYNCPSCTFSTTRLEVMVCHNRGHLSGLLGTYPTPVKKKKKSPAKKPRKVKALRPSSVDLDTSSDEVEKTLKKKQKLQGSASKTKQSKQKKVEPQIDIRTDLLAEWEDEDSTEESELTLNRTSDSEKLTEGMDTTADQSEMDVETTAVSEKLENSLAEKGEVEKSFEKEPEVTEEAKEESDKSMTKDIKDAIKSCFDFEEEEEDEASLVSAAATAGRKIPRVIPPTDKRKSKELDADAAVQEDEVQTTAIVKVSDNLNDSAIDIEDKTTNNKVPEDIDATFKELMETTAMPSLPEVNNSLKSEQNFHSGKTIKFPDKSEKPEPAESPTSPKKIEKPIKDSSEVATKLTNPKKRFVKSFEDFEQLMIEQRRLEEEKISQSLKAPITPQTEEANQLPSAPQESMSHVSSPQRKMIAAVRDENLDEPPLSPQDELTAQLEITKLRSKIMSKIIEESESVPSKMRRIGLHRTPRSKILESYKNDTSNTSLSSSLSSSLPDECEAILDQTKTLAVPETISGESSKNSESETTNKKEKHSPKKNIWTTRRGRISTSRLESNSRFSDDSPVVKRKFFSSRREARPFKHVSPLRTPAATTRHKRHSDAEIVVQEHAVMLEDDDKAKKNDELRDIETEVAATKEIEDVKQHEDVKNSVLTEQINDIIGQDKEDLMHVDDLSASSVLPDEIMKDDKVDVKETVEDAEEVIAPKDIQNDVPSEEVVMDKSNAVEPHEEIVDNSANNLDSSKADDVDFNSDIIKFPKRDNEINSQSDETNCTFDEEKEHVEIATELVEETKDVVEEVTAEEKVEELIAAEKVDDVAAKIDEAAAEENVDEVAAEEKIEEVAVEEKVDKVSVEEKVDEMAAEKNVEEIAVEEKVAEVTVEEKVEEIVGKEAPAEVVQTNEDHSNEVVFKCANNDVDEDSSSFAIKTNLTNLTEVEEVSALALATLADVKEQEIELAQSHSMKTPEKLEFLPEPLELPPINKIPPMMDQSEQVPIEGNLTVVSEKDLADGQVEITANVTSPNKKPVTLMNFSMDFSESTSDSNTNSESEIKLPEAEHVAKKPKLDIVKSPEKKTGGNIYARMELLDILEGNVHSDKPTTIVTHTKHSVGGPEAALDFDDMIPSQIITNSRNEVSPPDHKSKLLERLTTDSKEKPEKKAFGGHLRNSLKLKDSSSELKIVSKPSKTPLKNTKLVVTSASRPSSAMKSVGKQVGNKPVILSEKLIKPSYSIQKSTPIKRTIKDLDDEVLLQSEAKKLALDSDGELTPKLKSMGKAKILQQTIITPAGEIIQPAMLQADDNVFDINSMPIVLSDEILTPESIENMPIVLGSDIQTAASEKMILSNPVVKKSVVTTTPNRILNKSIGTPQMLHSSTLKTSTVQKNRPPRILQTVGNKLIKSSSPAISNTSLSSSSSTSKPGKYIIVSQSAASGNKYPGKKSIILKKPSIQTSSSSKVQSLTPEPSGNKIMIVTNPQGQQQRLLLTPTQQKMLGYQNQGSKLTKTVMRSNILQKSVLSKAGTSGLVSKNQNIFMTQSQKIIGSNSSQLITTSSGKMLVGSAAATMTPSPQLKPMKATLSKKLQMPTQKVYINQNKPQKTILIKNQHGQTVRKIQGTDDALLDQQVAEQLEAIKASSGLKFSPHHHQKHEIISSSSSGYKSTPPKTTLRRSYSKKPFVEMPKPTAKTITQTTQAVSSVATKQGNVPPLAPLSPEKLKENALDTATASSSAVDGKAQSDRPLKQLVIQDAMGNQTTITEGQILALPSETVDGQPQSYMLVTLDESGNLTPLNNEALMSLDPSLVPGGDLSNMVLQIDQGAAGQTEAPLTDNSEAESKLVKDEIEVPAVEEPTETKEVAEILEEKALEESVVVAPSEEQTVATTPSSGDTGQQLIVTGDPIATQKFLESLTEGTTDLSNILANAEGSILIQADGQQILINTNSDNQMLLSVNNDNLNVVESTEGGGNPIFATQPSKFQDILAAALADTDFQQEQHTAQSKIQSQLSPNSTLYPMNVGNVLETSLTLNSPIMTPLEVPSTNSKKIPDDEADILTQVPKNVDLPITITDPNISQTVAQQQVASMIANELQTNLELSLPISESAISAGSVGMNSPSFVYSLPTLEDSADMQRPFNSSMPLLTEDVDESNAVVTVVSSSKISEVPPQITEEAVEVKKEDAAEREAGETPPPPFDLATNMVDVVETDSDDKPPKPIDGGSTGESFMEEDEGLCTLGGEMCSSLSEPPPDMFDLPGGFEPSQVKSEVDEIPVSTNEVPSNFVLNKDIITEQQLVETPVESNSSGDASEDSCEIPIQPPIVANLSADLLQQTTNCAPATTTDNMEIESNNL